MSLVQIANNSGQTVWQRLLQLDAERERNHKLVGENQRLEKELEQTKLELKLERQNKLATNKQKSADVEQDPDPAPEHLKKQLPIREIFVLNAAIRNSP